MASITSAFGMCPHKRQYKQPRRGSLDCGKGGDTLLRVIIIAAGIALVTAYVTTALMFRKMDRYVRDVTHEMKNVIKSGYDLSGDRLS